MDTDNQPILVLDDDSKFRKLLVDILVTTGLPVMQARSARDATSLVEHEQPSLVIVDYRLPDEDGLTWVGKFRQSGAKMPIVLLSANWLDKQTFDTARNVHRISLILRKPIVPALFLDQIKSLLPSLRGAPQVVPQAMPGSEAAAMAQGVPASLGEPIKTDKLDRVRKAYIADLPRTWAQLADAVTRGETGDRDAKADAQMQGHKIRGSAGSVGLNYVSEMAGKVEDMLVAIGKVEAHAAKIIWSDIRKVIEECEHHIQEQLVEARAQQSSGAAESLPASSAKIIFLSKVHEPEKIGRKSYWNGTVDVLSVPTVKHKLIAGLGKGVVDGAIIRADEGDELLEACKAVRSLPGASALPLALTCKSINRFSKGELNYSGISLILDNNTTVQKIIDQLITLSRRRKPRILNVEDDETVSDIVQSILNNEGMLVRGLKEPIQTIQALEDFKPDLLLLDVQMPGISGYDVCRLIRSDPNWKSMPILFLTANGGYEARTLAFEAGADDFIAKPVVETELLTRVTAHLKRARAAGGYSRSDFWSDNSLATAAFYYLCERQNISNSGKFSICLIEIEHLHEISVMHGFQFALQVWSSLYQLVHERFTTETVRARWGDFGVALAFPESDTAAVEEAMQALRREFKQTVLAGSGSAVTCSFNFGIASCPRDGNRVEQVVSAASSRLVTEVKAVAPPAATNAPVKPAMWTGEVARPSASDVFGSLSGRGDNDD